jgi:hypothetical protein
MEFVLPVLVVVGGKSTIRLVAFTEYCVPPLSHINRLTVHPCKVTPPLSTSAS